ncbi:SDR family NAD(P)-dependent oxidoreductase [Herbiconiux sp.]|uniref:SDR family NAD(P)-dependent oxidoreductase n=1 Tax=Herbiconiux sp. TaxID=1871186 RepID=UPI0025C6A335|nr:SDR family NAD(P)-dependent oxidoreductase [Herbiconiux sp.]
MTSTLPPQTAPASRSSAPGRLSGRVAVVTGGARNVGRSYAERLAADGAAVAVLDVEDAVETVDAITAQGGRAFSHRVDLTDPEAVEASVDAVTRALGPVGILVNNAGIYPPKPLAEITIDDWRHMFAVNVEGVFSALQAYSRGMKQARWGRIINITSNSTGLVIPGLAHYISSKMAVIGLTRAAATELAEFGITVNAVGPSLVRTPVKTNPDELFDAVPALQAITRAEVPEDLVGAISFLASEDASFVTGQTLWVDGGLLR